MHETKLNGESLDIVSENVSKLKELFPEIVTEDKIDFDKLKDVLGKYTEEDKERYNFTWKGKSAALRLAQTPSTGTLRPCKEESKNWDTTENLYIEGDNLEVLKLLQKSYYGKIKMIYIDPPFNTGKEFVYPDDYKDNLQNYLEITGQVNSEGTKISTNTDKSGRYHTNWLNMIYPRLRLARNLLKQDGVIFISIDDNEVDNLRKVCNEIFGEENFITEFVVIRAEGGGLAKQVIKGHDYMLVFCKNISSFTPLGRKKDVRGKIIEKDGEEYWIQEDWLRKEFGKYGNCHYEEIEEFKGIEKKREIDLGIENGDYILIKKPNGMRIVGKLRNLKEDASKFYTILKHLSATGIADLKKLDMDTYFDFPKPVSLVKEALLGSTFFSANNSEIILDFFAGSSTTAHAVIELNSEDGGNRKFICVQLPESIDEKSETFKAGFNNICEIGKERIRRAGDKIVSEMNQNGQTSLDSKSDIDLDIGFKVFKLDSSNLSKWDPEYDNLEQTLLDSVKNMVPGRNELDLVYEIMLKYGIDLTLPIEEYRIQDKKFYSIGFGALIICLDDHLTSNLAYEIIKLKNDLSPEVMRVVFKDNGFASDSDKTNIKESLKTNGIEEFVTI